MDEKSPTHRLVHHHPHHAAAAAQLQQLELRGDTPITNAEEHDLKPPPGLQVGLSWQLYHVTDVTSIFMLNESLKQPISQIFGVFAG